MIFYRYHGQLQNGIDIGIFSFVTAVIFPIESIQFRYYKPERLKVSQNDEKLQEKKHIQH